MQLNYQETVYIRFCDEFSASLTILIKMFLQTFHWLLMDIYKMICSIAAQQTLLPFTMMKKMGIFHAMGMYLRLYHI